ncbi:hypothetical protein B0H15DRAFT_944834 [Mycena belliarum]|uniref:Uncharacterized protein n=1 Tax=Mycena belliarum TaxID=1033014 RepID=A0AAD6XZK8_9AGAR|nr:hypothetical protein B0H15DRAFT_944834 [Mycena belliae]
MGVQSVRTKQDLRLASRGLREVDLFQLNSTSLGSVRSEPDDLLVQDLALAQGRNRDRNYSCKEWLFKTCSKPFPTPPSSIGRSTQFQLVERVRTFKILLPVQPALKLGAPPRSAHCALYEQRNTSIRIQTRRRQQNGPLKSGNLPKAPNSKLAKKQNISARARRRRRRRTSYARPHASDAAHMRRPAKRVGAQAQRFAPHVKGATRRVRALPPSPGVPARFKHSDAAHMRCPAKRVRTELGQRNAVSRPALHFLRSGSNPRSGDLRACAASTRPDSPPALALARLRAALDTFGLER